MVRLKSYNSSPPGGFRLIDPKTGFKAHGWSVSSCASQWYHEQLRLGRKPTLDQCRQDVIDYTCADLMKTSGWQEWVMVVDHPAPKPPLVVPQTTVSVIIPTHAPGDRLSKVVQSVLGQANEIIVVSDGYNRLSGAHRPAKVRFLTTIGDKETGFATKCNTGAQVASGDYLWFLNDDCYPNHDCAEHLLSILRANPKIGAVGHLLRYPDGTIQHAGTERQVGKVGFPHRDVGNHDPTLKIPTEMEAVTAASMMVRRSAFEEVEGFDEGYFLYLEESDLCLKLRTAGWKVYFTPFAQATHEEHASSKLRTDLDAIIKNSVERFNSKWSGYLSAGIPKFQTFDEISTVNIDVVYVHLVGHPQHDIHAARFVDSVLKFPPGKDVNWVIACNSASGAEVSDKMKAVFAKLGKVTYFKHDNSGWDIGAHQAYARTSKAQACLFLGSTAYCRIKNWLVPMVRAFQDKGPHAIYGTCGNLGDPASKVSPHIRTTGYLCTPQLFNSYPNTVSKPSDRYPFEHGHQSLTVWAWSQGYQVYVVDADSVSAYPDWNKNPEGYHMGSQKSLLLGDRVTSPPFTQAP